MNKFYDTRHPKESINTKIERPDDKFENPKYDKVNSLRYQQTFDSQVMEDNL
jgi:hypothetical protein